MLFLFIMILVDPIVLQTGSNQTITFNYQNYSTTTNLFNETNGALFSSVTTYSICYQETANISTSCGGLNTGAYVTSGYNNVGNAYDGDYSTYANITLLSSANYLANYTKPSSSVDGNVIQIKVQENSIDTITNYSIPTACFNQAPLQIRINETNALLNDYIAGSCFDGSNYVQLFIKQTLLTLTTSPKLYEEAVFWNMSNTTTSIIGLNYSLQNVLTSSVKTDSQLLNQTTFNSDFYTPIDPPWNFTIAMLLMLQGLLIIIIFSIADEKPAPQSDMEVYE